MADRQPTFWEKVRDTEPARAAEGVRQALGALVLLGWVTIDDVTVNGIASGVAALASLALYVFTRRSVWSRRTVDQVATGHPHTTEPPDKR